MTKRKVEKFSITKAVKSNARDQVGQPPASRPIEDKVSRQTRKPKHKPTLADLTKNLDDAST